MNFTSTKTYALISGIILFALGLFGFAFRSGNGVPDSFLILSLILGFWGIIAGASNSSIFNR